MKDVRETFSGEDFLSPTQQLATVGRASKATTKVVYSDKIPLMDDRTRTLLDELASTFDSETAATSLLDRAGVPRSRLVPFGKMTPIEYWEWVHRELKKGLIQDGLPRLVQAAAELYPHNEKFKGKTAAGSIAAPSGPRPATSRSPSSQTGVGNRPPWAIDAGCDRYGRWATITVRNVETCFRWIPRGHFLMGSPADEPERFLREGPQVEVPIDHGFWLAETPVTQALWESVVVGENPSRFKAPRRPVEQVSWNDCQDFLAALNLQVPGLKPVYRARRSGSTPVVRAQRQAPTPISTISPGMPVIV